MNIDPRQLIQFATILEKGGVSDAAEALGIAQPALSRMLKDIEHRAGGPLLLNRRKPVTATPLGEQLAKQGMAIRHAVAQADRLVTDSKSGKSGHIRIGAPPFLCERVLPELLIRYRNEFPDVSFDLTMGYLDELIALVEGREIDLAFSTTVAQEGGGPTECRIISNLHHAVFCRADHPILKEKIFSSEILAQQNWVSHRKNSFVYKLAMEGLAEFGITKINTVLHSDSGSAIMRTLRSTDCLTILPMYAALADVNSKQLAIVPTPTLHTVPFGMTTSSTIELSMATNTFADWIAREMKLIIEEGHKTLIKSAR